MTGLTRSVSIKNLMSEIGWLLLSERRKFKMYNDIALEYFLNLLPPLVNERPTYNLRSGKNYYLLRKRTAVFRDLLYLRVKKFGIV